MKRTSDYTGLEKKKILIVEDVELNQFLARHVMESWGCMVEVAGNGQVAVERVLENDFDLVLMDIQMPVMDGIEATRQIRSLGFPKKAVPIVALTANVLKGDMELYMEAGMNDCLTKPYQEPELYGMVIKNIRKDADGVAEPRQVALYNLSLLEAISGGDGSFIKKMLRLFLDTVPKTLDDLTWSADMNDWLAVSKLAHKLKSTIDSMGIVDLKQVIRVIETNGKKGEGVEQLPGEVKRVSEVMEQVMEQVRKDHGL